MRHRPKCAIIKLSFNGSFTVQPLIAVNLQFILFSEGVSPLFCKSKKASEPRTVALQHHKEGLITLLNGVYIPVYF